MSKIEVNTIAPQSGTQVTLGESGDTITIPAGATFDASSGTLTLADGSVTNAKLANSSISINGSSVSLGGSTTIETGTSWQSTIVTGTTLTAVAGNGYWINTTSNACTITLPSSASVGDTIEFSDYLRTWGTNAVTINQNSLNFQGATSPNPVYDTNGQSVDLVYSGATQGWIPTVDDDVTFETDPSYSSTQLVIAGGGSGAVAGNAGNSEGAAGGGAGGYRTSSSSLTPGSVYTVTVGDGGALVTAFNTIGNDGSDSSISGTGVSITSTGGGGGGNSATVGRNGGSGGGGGSGPSNPYAGGISSPVTSPIQGYAGGAGSNNARAAGGGGAGAVGQDGDGESNAGNGGTGVASSITGSSVTRAGGGAGASYNGSNSGTGGSGGGGDGGSYTNPFADGGNGTVNTGSGGGGSTFSANGGSGGKGVVIISMADADYSGTTTGSPTVATGVSGQTVLTFNASGSYTA